MRTRKLAFEINWPLSGLSFFEFQLFVKKYPREGIGSWFSSSYLALEEKRHTISIFNSGISINMPLKNNSMYKNITWGKHMSAAVTSLAFLVCSANKKWKNFVWSSTSLKFGSGCGSNWRLMVFKNSKAWLCSFFLNKLRSKGLLSAINLKIDSNKSPLIGNPRNPLAIASIWVPRTSKPSLILFADAWKK